MKRYIQKYILSDLPNKLILLSGPRQCGKTTLSKQLYKNYDYFNYDSVEDRVSLAEKSWDRNKKLIIFDELHKMKAWKRWLKGIYDTEGIPPSILVTGSVLLDTYRRVGDSLAGRYFSYRLHPIDLKEASCFLQEDQNEIFTRLWNCSGFPEPFLRGDLNYYKRWRRSHLDIILRQDLIDLYEIRDIKSIETLVLLLKNRIGSSISYANLGRDLEKDPNTIKRWLELLENLYVIFKVTPFSKNVARSLLKEPKYYFYDHTYAENNNGSRLENIVALTLLKEIHFLEDVKGIRANLHYLRTKDGKEIDFLVIVEDKPVFLIEVKHADDKPASAFQYFSRFFEDSKSIQLVKDLKREKTYPSGVEVRSLIPWLCHINLF